MIDTTYKLMKISFNIYDKVNLIFNTYTFLFFESAADNLYVVGQLYHARRVSKTAWMVAEMEMEGSEICFAPNT